MKSIGDILKRQVNKDEISGGPQKTEHYQRLLEKKGGDRRGVAPFTERNWRII